MTCRYLHLNELEIRRYRGVRKPSQRMFYPPGSFSPGLNLLYGPNGSGKSTTAGAIKALLWPQLADSAGAGIVGVWDCAGKESTLALVGGTVSRSGMAGEGGADRLPAMAEPYSLALQDLLLAKDDELAAGIQREMFGGLDLTGAAEKLGLGGKPEGRFAAAKALREANRRVRDVAAKQRELSLRGGALKDLEKQLDEARRAGDRGRTLDEVARLHKLRATVASLQTEIDDYDERGVPKSLTADVRDTIAELHAQSQAKRREIDALREKRMVACEALAEVAFPDDRPPRGEFLDELNNRLARLQDIERDLATHRRELAEAERLAADSRVFVGGMLPPENVAWSLDDLVRIRPLYKRYNAALTRRNAVDSALRLATEGLDKGNLERQADQAVDCLLDWLAAATETETEGERSGGRAGTIVLATNLAWLLASTGLAVFASLWWLVSAALAAGAVMWSVRRATRRATTAPATLVRQSCQEKYRGLSSAPEIDEWTPQSVRRALREAQERQAEVRQVERRMARAQSLEHDLREANRTLDDAFRALAEEAAKLGIEFAEAPPDDWLELSEAHARWQEARARCQTVRAAVDSLCQAHATELERCREIWQPYCEVRAGDAGEVRATIAGLASRVENWREATRRIRETEAIIGRLAREANDVEEKARGLVDRVFPEMEMSLESALETMAAQLPDCVALRECHARRDAAMRDLREREAMARTLPGWQTDMADWTGEILEAEVAEANAQAANYESLHEAVVGLRRDIERAGRGHDLTDALQTRDAALANVVALARKAALAEAGMGLLDFLRETSGLATAAVLQRARSLFADISGHRYELLVEGDKTAGFSAGDSLTGERNNLDELSSATRIQLLLAVRVAFLECQEEGALSPPLILDEVLANSDGERAHAAMQAIVHVVRRGRQVFYLTAQEDELDKWRDVLADATDLPHRLLVLPLANPLPPPEPTVRSLAAAPAIPPPTGEDYDAYGEMLAPPPFVLFGGDAGAIHVFYLLLDPDALYRLLQARCHTWGQFKTMLRHGGEAAFAKLGVATDPVFIRRVEAHAAVLVKLRELYAIGRGSPISQDVMMQDDSPVRTLKFADAVARLAEEVGGDAKRLVEALKERAIKGFLQRKIDELEDWLIERGYLDPQPVLPSEELVPRTLAECANALDRSGVAVEQARGVLDRALARSVMVDAGRSAPDGKAETGSH